MTSDPIARVLAQVEREAVVAGNADDGEGLASVLFSVQAERDVWKAAAERYLRALWPLAEAAHDMRPWSQGIGPEPDDGVWSPELKRADAHRAAACFPPEREGSS